MRRTALFFAFFAALVACARPDPTAAVSESRICGRDTSRLCDERRMLAIAIREYVGPAESGEAVYLTINGRDPEPWTRGMFPVFIPGSKFSAGDGRRKFDVSIDRWIDHEFIEVVVVMSCGFTCGTRRSYIYRKTGNVWHYWQAGGTNWVS